MHLTFWLLSCNQNVPLLLGPLLLFTLDVLLNRIKMNDKCPICIAAIFHHKHMLKAICITSWHMFSMGFFTHYFIIASNLGISPGVLGITQPQYAVKKAEKIFTSLMNLVGYQYFQQKAE